MSIVLLVVLVLVGGVEEVGEGVRGRMVVVPEGSDGVVAASVVHLGEEWKAVESGVDAAGAAEEGGEGVGGRMVVVLEGSDGVVAASMVDAGAAAVIHLVVVVEREGILGSAVAATVVCSTAGIGGMGDTDVVIGGADAAGAVTLRVLVEEGRVDTGAAVGGVAAAGEGVLSQTKSVYITASVSLSQVASRRHTATWGNPSLPRRSSMVTLVGKSAQPMETRRVSDSNTRVALLLARPLKNVD